MPDPRWRRWGWVVRWAGTLLGIAYVARLIHPGKLRAAFSVVSLGAVLASIAIVAAGIVLGAVRWRIALRAYGARSQPGMITASRLYFIAVFYNTFLPGAVAGDVVRGVATRNSFEARGATGALAVVFVERLLGLFALCALILVGLGSLGDTLDSHSLWLWSVLGGAASLAALLLLPLGRRLGRFLPSPLARIAERLPVVVRPRDFAAAALLSFATQLTAVIAGWLVLRDLHPGIRFGDALLILPVAAATAFLPITVGGTGAREAAFVLLCGELLGMASDDAVAASLLIWLATLVVGAFGGLLSLTGRGERSQPPPAVTPIATDPVAD